MKMNRYTSLFMALAMTLGLLLGACSDKDEPNPFYGNVEEIDGKFFTTFHLRDFTSTHWEKSEDVGFLLVCPEAQTSYEFKGSIAYNTGGNHRVFTCRLDLGDTAIPDGIYCVSLQV